MQAFRWVISPPASLISFFTYLNEVALTNSCCLRHDCDAYSGWKGKRSGYEQRFTASLLLLVSLLIVGLIVCQLLGGVAWVYCNLLRDSLVSGLEKSCFQLKGFLQIRLAGSASFDDFQVSKLQLWYPMCLDSWRIPQRKCKYVF